MLSIFLSFVIVVLLAVVILQRIELLRVKSASALRRKHAKMEVGSQLSQNISLQQTGLLNEQGGLDQKLDQRVDEIENLEETESEPLHSEDADTILGIKNVSKETPVKSQVINREEENNKPLEVVAIILQSEPNRSYSGYELLQSILSSGMRYGDLNIFHRYEKKTARGSVLYSLASAVAPGSFDLTNMGGFSTPALSLFLKPDAVNDSVSALDAMLKTAQQLSDDLGGVLLTQQQQPLTQEVIRDIYLQLKTAQSQKKNLDLFEQV